MASVHKARSPGYAKVSTQVIGLPRAIRAVSEVTGASQLLYVASLHT